MLKCVKVGQMKICMGLKYLHPNIATWGISVVFVLMYQLIVFSFNLNERKGNVQYFSLQ